MQPQFPLSAALSPALLALTFALCSCAATQPGREPEPQATPEQKAALAAQFHALLVEKCWSCHGEPGKKVRGRDGTLDYILDYDKLVENKLLVPGDVKSKLCSEVETGAMPLEYDPDTRKMFEKKLPKEAIDLTLRWMKAGSPRWKADARVEAKPAIFGWSEVRPPTPPSREAMAMAEGPGNTVVVVGGSGQAGPCTDTWVFAGGAWKEAGQGMPPGAAGATAMAYDHKRAVSVLVGLDMSTHEWDGSGWKEVKTPATPPARQEFSVAYDPRQAVVVLFGGFDAKSGTYFNDAWTYDGAAWKKLEVKDAPMARHCAVMAWSGANDALLMFGGKNFYGRYADTWLFDGKAWKVQTPSDAPAACENMLMAASPSGPVMVCSAPADDHSTTWHWTGKNWLKGPELPKSRTQGGMAFDGAGRTVLIYGGAFGTGLLNDCWQLKELK